MIKSSDSTRVVLGNGANLSLRRSGQRSRVPTTARKLKFRKYVSVEALPNQLEMRVLYASDILPKEEDAHYPYKTTHPVAIDLNSLTEEEDQTVVRQGEPFDIRIEGIFTENFDKNIPIARRRNEIIMYSLEGGDEHPSHQERQDEGIPTIHYNHKSDTAVKPDSYFSVPDSKSLVTYYTGSGTPVKRVSHRYKILEMDEVDDVVRDAIDGISNMSEQLSTVALAMPFLSVLSPAVAMAGEVGRRALDSYAKPDNVISIDMRMKIAPKDGAELRASRPEKYMRYGYYFFLSKKVNARLFASTMTSENLVLVMRKVSSKVATSKKDLSSTSKGSSAKSDKSDSGTTATSVESTADTSDQTYIPLEKVSYLVVRVGIPTGDEDVPEKRAPKLSPSMVCRLQNIVETAESTDAKIVKENIVNIMRQVRGNPPT